MARSERTMPVTCDRCGHDEHTLITHTHPDGSRSSTMTCPSCNTTWDGGTTAPLTGMVHLNLGGGRGGWYDLAELAQEATAATAQQTREAT